MNRPSRPWKRSPALQWLAAFAWLWLVVLPVHGQGMTMCHLAPTTKHALARDSMTNGSPMPMASAQHAHHAAATTKASISAMPANDCCHSGHGHPGLAGSCHCAAMAGSILASVGSIELLPWLSVHAYPSTRETSAPDIADGPPLRPPAA